MRTKRQRTVTVVIEHPIPIGNFSVPKITLGESMLIGDDEDPIAIRQKIRDQLREEVLEYESITVQEAKRNNASLKKRLAKLHISR